MKIEYTNLPTHIIHGKLNFRLIARSNGMYDQIMHILEEHGVVSKSKSKYCIITINGTLHGVRRSPHWGQLPKSTFTLNGKTNLSIKRFEQSHASCTGKRFRGQLLGITPINSMINA